MRGRFPVFDVRVFLLGSGKNFYWEVTDSDHGLGRLIDAFLLWSRAELRDQDPKVVMSLALVFDELYMNALLHGYVKNPASFWVSIDVHVKQDKILAIYRDRATEFNPLSIAKEQNSDQLPHKSIEETPIGGLGIHLISQFVDDISYSFVDNCNELRLTKKLRQPGTYHAGTRQDHNN